MDRPVARTGYESADLAYIHDAGFGFHARAASEELMRRLRGAGHDRGLVVDLGCGTGILARIVGDAGYAVVGHDQSAEMLRIARRNAPQARFKRASFLDVDFPECVAVTAVGEVLGYAFDSRARRPAIRSLFHKVHAALLPGGVFLFDVAGPGRGPARGVRRTLFEGEDWTICSETTEDRVAGTLRRHSVFFRRRDGGYRRGEELHVLNLLEPGDVADDLVTAGFRVRRLRHYGDLRLQRGLNGFLATVPGRA
jgi:SAM-dependent methyltransferase